MEAFQPFSAQITTTLVATGMAAATCWQRGRGRVAGAFGGIADARHADRGNVSELQIASRVERKLFGARLDGLWFVQEKECCNVCGV